MEWGNSEKGKIMMVGFGPGPKEHMTFRAYEALKEADVIVGYTTYIELVKDLIEGKEIYETGMREEVDRAEIAIERAEEGKKVAVVSSGDSGVYGLAGLVLEMLREKGWTREDGLAVEIIPGASAINACASLVGAPLMHDFASISLSDLLTPWEVILERIESAAKADFVIGLYNPASGTRTRQIIETREVLLKHRAKETPVAIVKSGYRDGQTLVLTNLDEMLNHKIGMLTTILIGNSSTYVYDGLMITPRGYHTKYSLAGKESAAGVLPDTSHVESD